MLIQTQRTGSKQIMLPLRLDTIRPHRLYSAAKSCCNPSQLLVAATRSFTGLCYIRRQMTRYLEGFLVLLLCGIGVFRGGPNTGSPLRRFQRSGLDSCCCKRLVHRFMNGSSSGRQYAAHDQGCQENEESGSARATSCESRDHKNSAAQPDSFDFGAAPENRRGARTRMCRKPCRDCSCLQLLARQRAHHNCRPDEELSLRVEASSDKSIRPKDGKRQIANGCKPPLAAALLSAVWTGKPITCTTGWFPNLIIFH
jgi:hypothetical protein